MATLPGTTKAPRSRTAKKSATPPAPRKASRAAVKAAPVDATAKERVVTTVRFEPGLHAELAALSHLEHASFNQIVEAGMRLYVQHRRVMLEQQLERALAALRARSAKDGDFDAAIARLVEAEASVGPSDPAEGRLVLPIGTDSVFDVADSDLAARVQALMVAS